MPPNTCSAAAKTQKQKPLTGHHLGSNNDALYNLELLRFCVVALTQTALVKARTRRGQTEVSQEQSLVLRLPGFHGAAAHGDKKLAFPASGAKKGDKADVVTLKGVHLCCGNCVKIIAATYKGFDGVTVACYRKARTVSLTGSGIDVVKAVAALNKAGFHGTIAKKK